METLIELGGMATRKIEHLLGPHHDAIYIALVTMLTVMTLAILRKKFRQ